MRYVYVVIAISSAAACSSGAKPSLGTQRPSHRLFGHVAQTNGLPAADSVLVATDPVTRSEVGVAYTDPQGYFELESPVSRVALTATTRHASVFLVSVDADHGNIEILLDANCALVRGHAMVGVPAAHIEVGLLRFARFSDEVGDVFGVRVETDNQFEACLPRAEYVVRVSKDFASQRILTFVPPSTDLTVHAVHRQLANTPPAKPLELTADSELTFVDFAQTSARLIGLGESNHGTQEFVAEQARLSIELARRYQFTLVLLETGYGETLALDDYVTGVDVDIVTAIKKLDYWTWNTKAFLDSLNQIKRYNQTVPARQRLHVFGTDIQSTGGALDDLLKQDTNKLSNEQIRVLELLRDKNGQKWRDFTAPDRALIQGLLEELAAKRGSHGLDSTVNRHALSARSLLLQLDYLEAKNAGEDSRIRDKAIATMTMEALGLDPNIRATLWAHMSHLAREFIVGAPSAGAHLAASLGSGYRVFALLASGGSARARDPKRNNEIVSHLLPVSPGHSLEGALANIGPGLRQATTYWVFDRAKDATRRWLRELHWARSFGAVYPGDQASFELYDLSALDGAILFKEVTPSEANGN